MAHKLTIEDDGILRFSMIGNMDHLGAEAMYLDFQQYLKAATQENPVNAVFDSSETEKVSSAARKTLARLNGDPHFGNIAILGASRTMRVLASFIGKATNRSNFDFFDTEEAALQWLKNND